MIKDLNPTTRMYPRRLDEAFQDKVERAQWFYPPERNTALRSVLLSIVGIVMWIGVGFLMLYR